MDLMEEKTSVFNRIKQAAIHWGRRATQFIVVMGGGRPLDLNNVKYVEEAIKNSAAIASVRWLTRNLSEAPICVGKRDKNDLVFNTKSACYKLLKRPNDHYSTVMMLRAALADYVFTGNGYLIKLRDPRQPGGINGSGRVVSLWWVPSFMITPLGDPNDDTIFIKNYKYVVDSDERFYSVDDVIHFRDGFDSNNPRVGMSRFQSLIREILSDNEAGNWTLALLKNMGVPGVVISPDKNVEIDADGAEKIKNDFSNNFTGVNRGRPMVTSAPVKVLNMAFDAKQMDLQSSRRLNEERITAVVGIPAVVVGLGAGLDHSTFANFSEAREAAYESCMIPILQDFADVLNLQLTPEFHSEDYEIYFDISKVRVLQPDINALHTRVRGDLMSGMISLDEARKQCGYQPLGDGKGDVFFVPNGVSVSTVPGVAVAQPDTGTPADDINGNPTGGAPTSEDLGKIWHTDLEVKALIGATNGANS